MRRALSVLLVCLLLGTSALALTPTPSPTPTVEPLVYPEFSIFADADGERCFLREEMILYQGGGICADGVLHFTPLAVFVEKEELPQFELTGTLICGAAAYNERTYVNVYGCQLFRETQSGLESVELEGSADIAGSDLEKGSYILYVNCTVGVTDNGSGNYVGLGRIIIN